MASLLDHIEYLSKEIGARPAGTEEEQQAALYIAEQFQKESSFPTAIEEFTSSSNLEGASAIFAVVTFVVTILAMLFNVLVIGYTILISPLWNAYTDAATKGDYEWIRRTFRKSLMMWCASVILGLVVLVLSGWFFRIWVGDSVTIPFAISSCVLLYVCIFNLNNCAT